MSETARWDKWDYIEVVYRTALLVLLSGTTLYAVVKITESLRSVYPAYNVLVYLITTVLFIGWLVLTISATAYLVFVSTGTFRPREELPVDGEDLEDIT